jgi:hypothetical protein
MKTLEKLVQQGHEQRAENAAREQAYITMRRLHIQRIALLGGALTLACYLTLLAAWHEAWWFLLLAAGPGYLGGQLISRFGGGILRSMLLYAVIQGLYCFLGYALSGWSFRESGLGMLGGILWTFMFLISWPVIGGFFGHCCETFDLDHVQI